MKGYQILEGLKEGMKYIFIPEINNDYGFTRITIVLVENTFLFTTSGKNRSHLDCMTYDELYEYEWQLVSKSNDLYNYLYDKSGLPYGNILLEKVCELISKHFSKIKEIIENDDKTYWR